MHDPDNVAVELEKLMVDHTVQRSLDMVRVNKIANNLDMSGLGVVSVSLRADGTYHVLDGQHRVEALRVAGYHKGVVFCQVYRGLTLQEEARMFRLLNDASKVGYLERFKVRVVEGDKSAMEISGMVTRSGWKIAMGAKNGGFSAVAALERIYNMDPWSAEQAVSTATAAWDMDQTGVDGRIIEGLGLVFVRYGDGINQEDMIRKLKKYPGGPGFLIGRARGLSDIIKTKVPRAVAEIIVEVYNSKRRGNALPGWRTSPMFVEDEQDAA